MSGTRIKIIICAAAAAALGALGAAVYFSFAPTAIDGAWELVENPENIKSTPDEADSRSRVYYTFAKPGEYGDGVYKTYFDGGVEEGEYKLSEKNEKKYIDMGTGELEYKTEGTKLFGNARLTITLTEQTGENTEQASAEQEYVFVQASAPDYESEHYDSYKTDEALIGEWSTSERKLAYFTDELSYKQAVRFFDKGIMTIHYTSADLALDRIMYYAYSAENGVLYFSPVSDKETKYTVSYELDKDGNLRFTDDVTSASIFADEFFSEVTYIKTE